MQYVVSVLTFAGYLFGHFAWLKPNGEFTGAVQYLLQHIPGFSLQVYEKVHILCTRWDSGILTSATTTPLPYGIFSITSGVFGINIFVFRISQGIKFVFFALITRII
jgi:hypothetical protein